MLVRPSKYVFAKEEVRFLEYIKNENGTKLLGEKVKAIIEFLKPATVKQLRRYCGMMNFYRRFIADAARLQIPLNHLLKGRKLKSNSPIQWSAEWRLKTPYRTPCC